MVSSQQLLTAAAGSCYDASRPELLTSGAVDLERSGCLVRHLRKKDEEERMFESTCGAQQAAAAAQRAMLQRWRRMEEEKQRIDAALQDAGAARGHSADIKSGRRLSAADGRC